MLCVTHDLPDNNIHVISTYHTCTTFYKDIRVYLKFPDLLQLIVYTNNIFKLKQLHLVYIKNGWSKNAFNIKTSTEIINIIYRSVLHKTRI